MRLQITEKEKKPKWNRTKQSYFCLTINMFWCNRRGVHSMRSCMSFCFFSVLLMRITRSLLGFYSNKQYTEPSNVYMDLMELSRENLIDCSRCCSRLKVVRIFGNIMIFFCDGFEIGPFSMLEKRMEKNWLAVMEFLSWTIWKLFESQWHSVFYWRCRLVFTQDVQEYERDFSSHIETQVRTAKEKNLPFQEYSRHEILTVFIRKTRNLYQIHPPDKI